MKILLDAHLPPSMAVWIKEKYNLECYSFDFLDWKSLSDKEVFFKAKAMDAVIISKDEDFIDLLQKFNAPPKIIWLTCGNTSKKRLKEIMASSLSIALRLLNNNDLVEIKGN
jgi:predicted nuclease of predicted toxin-antitoxin system